MLLSFTKFSPGGNDTIIVQSEVPGSKRVQIAQTLMSATYLSAEQVGYLSYPKIDGVDGRLEMMGGELCVNALRSAVALLAQKTGKRIFRMQSSGSEHILQCESQPNSEGYDISIRLTVKPVMQDLEPNTTLVGLGGISHLLWEFNTTDVVDPLQIFEEMRQRYHNEFDLLDAFGVIPFVHVHDEYKISPVVFVRGTNTIIPETGCGSGSIALAILLFIKTGRKEFSIRQPSGSVYRVSISREGEEFIAILGGIVRTLVSGEAFLL